MQAALAGHLGRAGEARHHLHDHDAAVRATALRALSRAGDLGAAELSAALSDAAADVRIAALELGARRPAVPAASLADRLGDEDDRVVETAAWACGERFSSESGVATAAQLGEPSAAANQPTDTNQETAGHSRRAGAPAGEPSAAANRETEGQARRAAANRLAGEVVGKLARVAAEHADALCRESAIAALGAIGDPRGLPAVLAGLNDKPAVRRRSVISLAPFDGLEVEAALERAGRDRDRQVRAAAAELQPPSGAVQS